MRIGFIDGDQAAELQHDARPAVGLRNGVIFTTLIWAVFAALVAATIT